ncbi:MAG: flagellar basal body rod protein FlgC [Planctomycetota bacterium]
MTGGVFTAMDISASALAAERARMNVIAQNLANANTTHDYYGNKIPYRRQRIHFRPGAPEFTGSSTLGVRVERLSDDPSDFKRVLQPGHPDADADGYVLYPNVDVPIEMVDMMMAARAYEANVTAMESAKQVMRGALQIIA